MLVLHRRVEDKVYIGEGENLITVTVVKIERGKVVLGFTAPRHIPIARDDMIRAKPGENSTLPIPTSKNGRPPLTLYDELPDEEDSDLDY